MISIGRQCDLLGISRSGYYYRSAEESPENLQLMRLIDEQYTGCPFLWCSQDDSLVKTTGVLCKSQEDSQVDAIHGVGSYIS